MGKNSVIPCISASARACTGSNVKPVGLFEAGSLKTLLIKC